ncbi:spliceosome-associated protein CWC15 homolog isoform X8 [Manis javanica]|uniref:spliceosome-associated protein CWC15 homolog isoform X8 n=1 Tax=Manis javanica TaxID=9974 RepID=UPI003C6D388D
MTRASRPTFEAARGGRGKGEGDLSQLSKQHSSRDLPYTKIKYRQTTQDAPEEVRNRDFRRELEERELLLEKKIGIIQLEEEDEDEDFEEESDDDGTAALLAELERIKKERAEEQARKHMPPFIAYAQRMSSYFSAPDSAFTQELPASGHRRSLTLM